MDPDVAGHLVDLRMEIRTLRAHLLEMRHAQGSCLRIINRSGYPLEYATEGSIGLDLRAIGDRAYFDIEPGRRRRFATGIHVELPRGVGALVQPRSGLATHHGVFTITGTIDADYRGEIAVLLLNSSPSVFRVNRGDRIAQLVPIVVPPRLEIEEVEALSETARGDKGFGSTGGYSNGQTE